MEITFAALDLAMRASSAFLLRTRRLPVRAAFFRSTSSRSRLSYHHLASSASDANAGTTFFFVRAFIFSPLRRVVHMICQHRMPLLREPCRRVPSTPQSRPFHEQ